MDRGGSPLHRGSGTRCCTTPSHRWCSTPELAYNLWMQRQCSSWFRTCGCPAIETIRMCSMAIQPSMNLPWLWHALKSPMGSLLPAHERFAAIADFVSGQVPRRFGRPPSLSHSFKAPAKNFPNRLQRFLAYHAFGQGEGEQLALWDRELGGEASQADHQQRICLSVRGSIAM